MTLLNRRAACVAIGLSPLLAIAQVESGALAPDLLGKTYEGEDLLVSSQQGKVVVASFWASWCGPCRQELPMLEGLQKVIGQERVKVVAISVESREVFARLGKAAKSLALTFVHDADKSIQRAYGVRGLPHLVVIGKDGHFLRKYVGYSEQQVDKVIDQVQAALQEP